MFTAVDGDTEGNEFDCVGYGSAGSTGDWPTETAATPVIPITFVRRTIVEPATARRRTKTWVWRLARNRLTRGRRLGMLTGSPHSFPACAGSPPASRRSTLRAATFLLSRVAKPAIVMGLRSHSAVADCPIASRPRRPRLGCEAWVPKDDAVWMSPGRRTGKDQKLVIPDGAFVVERGKTRWVYLVEVKTAGAPLRTNRSSATWSSRIAEGSMRS